MGADTFESTSLGKTANEAFRAAVEHARYMHGHGGYSGTIAEKGSFVLFELPPRCTVDKILNLMEEVSCFSDLGYLRDNIGWAKTKTDKRKAEVALRKEQKRQEAFWKRHAALASLLKKAAPVYDEKWGPAVCFEIKGTKATEIKKQRGRGGTHDRVFLFCGYASC